MDLRVNHLFSSPLFVDFLQLDLNSLREYCYSVRENSEGRKFSNVGGWQSNDLSKDTTELQNLFKEILIRVNIAHIELGFKEDLEQQIDNIWININKKGHFNNPHIHSGGIFSGVFYVNCSPNCGNINFLNPVQNHGYHIHESDILSFNGFNSVRYFQVPEAGKLLFFPSWLQHYVEPNNTDIDRISISFNTTLKSKEK